MGFFGRFRRRKGRAVNVDALVARANAAGIDGAVVREILESSRGPGGRIDWGAAAAKAQARGLDVEKLRGLMR